MENSSEIFKIVDPDGTLRYANPAFGRLLGYDPEGAVGMNVLDYVHPDDLPGVIEQSEEAMKPGGVSRNVAEYRFRHADGSWRYLESTGTYLLEEPSVRGVVVTARDVTERKEMEEALRESERRYATLLADEPALVYRCTSNDSGWPMEFASDYATELTGYSPRDLMPGGGVKYGDLIVEKDHGRVWDEVQEALGERRSFRIQYAIRRRDGTLRHVEEYGRAIHAEDGRLEAIEGLIHDVTERKEAEEAFKRSQAQFRAVFDGTAVGMALVDVEGRLMESNPALQEMLGYTSEELREKRFEELTHPDDVAADVELFEKLNERELDHYRLDKRYVRKDGGVVWGHLAASSIHDDEGETRFFIRMVEDITERKRAEERMREAEERYRTLVEQIPAVTYVDLPDNTCVYVGPRIETTLGYTAREWLENAPWSDLIHPEDRERVLAADERSKTLGEPYNDEYRMICRGGDVVWVRDEAVLIRDENGEPAFWQGILIDVTERKSADEAVRRSEASLADAERMAHLGSFEWNVRTGDVWWSDETYRIYGLEPGRSIPTFDKLLEVVHPDDRELLKCAVERSFRDHEPYDFEHRVVRPNGETRWVHRRAEVVRDERDEPARMLGTVHDITEQKTLEDELERQAFHDALTGLPNRPLFFDRLRHSLDRTERRTTQGVAVLFMDLDGFKRVNDSLGHDTGDRLLVEVAERLRGCLRPEDTLARFGGDEFVVLLEDVESPSEAVTVAERVLDEFREPFVLADRQLFVSTSIGVALRTADAGSPEDLLRAADTAMYRAKEQSSGYSVFDPAMYERAVKRLDLENDLRRAIEAREFVVHYQPILRLQGDVVVWGMEALVRWKHPERGLLSPSEFVPLVEESGLVIPMGEQVLREACRRAKELQEEHPRVPPLVMCVNLSAKQLRRPDLTETVKEVLRETGLEARSLSLDVTETVYIRAMEGNTNVVDGLKKLGVGIAIDDFGVGYSSLSYLKRLSADVIKIDKSFVRGVGEDIEDTAIVRMIIELAHTLGMEVVAEGVESEDQKILLRELGCDFVQGFHLSKPLSIGAASSFLAR